MAAEWRCIVLPVRYELNLYMLFILGHPVPGGYKYGNLALQVGGVSDETVK
jgi:hypothetical protein